MVRAYLKAAAFAVALLGGFGCASDDGNTGSGGDRPASYPEGPYGLELGDVIPNMTLRTTDGEAVALDSFFGGSARAALLYVTAAWCFTCGPEIGWLNGYPPRLDGDLNAMIVLLQNKQFENATAEDAEVFGEAYGAQFPTLLDPDGGLDLFRDEAFIPVNVLVDTATMRVTLRETGFDRASLEPAIGAILENE